MSTKLKRARSCAVGGDGAIRQTKVTVEMINCLEDLHPRQGRIARSVYLISRLSRGGLFALSCVAAEDLADRQWQGLSC